MNTRTQITIDAELQRRAQAKAADLGISFAEYVRRLVAGDLDTPKRRASDISALFDLGASERPTDIASDKDKMIGEAVWEDHRRDIDRSSRVGARRRRTRR